MSPYAKFGLDRPSRSAGHRQHTDKQTDIMRFIMQIQPIIQEYCAQLNALLDQNVKEWLCKISSENLKLKQLKYNLVYLETRA